MTFFAILNEWHCWSPSWGSLKMESISFLNFFFYEDKYESLVKKKKKWEG